MLQQLLCEPKNAADMFLEVADSANRETRPYASARRVASKAKPLNLRRRHQARRRKPFADVGSRPGLPGFPQELLALQTGRHILRLFPEALSFFGKTVFET
jgi:hypothetical protein